MPRLPNWVTDCSVYFYEDEAAASQGRRVGGCGFIAAAPGNSAAHLAPGPWWRFADNDDWTRFFAYAVTNWHVAQQYPVARVNRLDGSAKALRLEGWHRHPTADLAIAPFEHDPGSYRMVAVPVSDMLDKDSCNYLEVGLGDDVFMMSRFIEEVERYSSRRRIYEQVQSPRRFARAEDGALPLNLEEIPTPPIIALLGVSGGYLYGPNEKILGASGQPTGLKVRLHSGMGWCVPSWKLLELLNCDALKAQREALRNEWEETPPAGTPC